MEFWRNLFHCSSKVDVAERKITLFMCKEFLEYIAQFETLYFYTYLAPGPKISGSEYDVLSSITGRNLLNVGQQRNRNSSNCIKICIFE